MLKAILIDDERPALDEMTYLLEKNSVKVIGAFLHTEGVLEFVINTKPDIIFLDIELREMNGIDYGIELQNKVENITIIFVTAYPEYALEAFRAYPLDYITKPVEEERLIRTLRHIQELSVCREGYIGQGFYIRCFGEFEVMCGDNRVKFPTKKTREVLAYLLCNEGTVLYRDELANLIFDSGDEEKNANNLRVTLFRIRNAFHKAGIGEKQFHIRENLSIELANGVCDIVDYQRFVRKNLGINDANIMQAEKIVNLVNGELLTEIDTLWITEKREWIIIHVEKLLINMSIYYLSAGYSKKAEAALLRLLALEPLSSQGFHRLLELYIKTNESLKYRSCYERYREMVIKELREQPLKIYSDYYEKFIKL